MNALSVLSRCFFLVPTTAALSSDSFRERAIEAAGPRVRREESIHQSSETEEEAPVGGKEQGSGTAPESFQNIIKIDHSETHGPSLATGKIVALSCNAVRDGARVAR